MFAMPDSVNDEGEFSLKHNYNSNNDKRDIVLRCNC